MTREEALRNLRDHEPELRQAGVRALYLFGSTARNQAGPESDVDVACDLDEKRGLSLLDFIDVKLRLSDLLGTEVDLVDREALRPRVRARVEADLVRVF
jgi:uncharacterized protein